jgi:S-methylmethionine-dependent homocysteine/selenocysteine methylase
MMRLPLTCLREKNTGRVLVVHDRALRTSTLSAMDITILDGGTGRELQRIGAPFRQPEWSALALIEGSDWVVQAHQNFIAAGANVVTTNSYACVPFHIGADRFAQDGHRLAMLAGELARQAVSVVHGSAVGAPSVRVAGSIPPVLGSYRPDLFDLTAATPLLEILVDALAGSVDQWLIETTSSIDEARAAIVATNAASLPRWISFTLDDRPQHQGPSVLRSGESIVDALDACAADVDAVLFNCSQPEVMANAVEQAQDILGSAPIQIGVYGNAFDNAEPDHGANESLTSLRDDLSVARYADFAESWIERGATIIGGCCGISPDHIRAIAAIAALRLDD